MHDNNKKTKNFGYLIWLLPTIILMTSCAKNPSQSLQDCSLNLSTSPEHCFQQHPGNSIKPSKYFTCGCIQNPNQSNLGTFKKTKKIMPKRIQPTGGKSNE